mgnify:CR=1 FL=1
MIINEDMVSRVFGLKVTAYTHILSPFITLCYLAFYLHKKKRDTQQPAGAILSYCSFN